MLSRIDPSLRRGLSAQTVRLITGEPEPEVQAYKAERVVVEVAQIEQAAQAQVLRKAKQNTTRRRRPKSRG